MSFSSGQWTIAELCVWIATRSKAAVNGLEESYLRSLKAVDEIHPGAYAARDDIVEAAQNGSISVTCADYQTPKPTRRALSVEFWKEAEIRDSRASWMADFAPKVVARRVDRTGEEFDDLLISSGSALAAWPAPQPAAEAGLGDGTPISNASAPGGRLGAAVPINDEAILGEMNLRAAKDGDAFSVRSFVLENDNRISGPNHDAKIRRLQRKFDKTEG